MAFIEAIPPYLNIIQNNLNPTFIHRTLGGLALLPTSFIRLQLCLLLLAICLIIDQNI